MYKLDCYKQGSKKHVRALVFVDSSTALLHQQILQFCCSSNMQLKFKEIWSWTSMEIIAKLNLGNPLTLIYFKH